VCAGRRVGRPSHSWALLSLPVSTSGIRVLSLHAPEDGRMSCLIPAPRWGHKFYYFSVEPGFSLPITPDMAGRISPGDNQSRCAEDCVDININSRAATRAVPAE